jgi:hypothetical protein
LKTFESFYSNLISDEQWFEFASKNHKLETFKLCAEKVYAVLLSDPVMMDVTPMREHRNHVFNKLAKILPDKPKAKAWHEVEREKIEKKEAEEKEKEWKPASGEHVDRCVAEFDEMMRNSTMMSKFPPLTHKQRIEEGNWIPKKGPAYPMTTAMEAYNKERKIAYYRYCYDPITRDKLPTWMEEEEYNELFDNEAVESKLHPHWETLKEL